MDKKIFKIKNYSHHKYNNYDKIMDAYDNANNELCKLLIRNKNMIDNYTSKENTLSIWDRVKKYTNNYELIFSLNNKNPSISKFRPCSRSFFKIWETIHDLKDTKFGELINFSEKLKFGNIAESPGGFIEALINYRKGLDDEFHCISLVDSNCKWKLHKYEKKYNINYYTGKDGTGDIYKIENIDDYVNKVGKNSCDIVTCDGGFSIDEFNNQEESFFNLFLCEVCTSLKIQKKGGSLFIKIFDTFNKNTILLLYLLKICYNEINIIKPHTSRCANSEKYLVCSDFKNYDISNYFVEKIYDIIKNNNSKNFVKEISLMTPLNFLKDIYDMNTYFTNRQIEFISRTISFCIHYSKNYNNHIFNNIKEKQITKAKEWCKKYSIEINSLYI